MNWYLEVFVSLTLEMSGLNKWSLFYMTLGKIVKDLLQSQPVFTYSKSTKETPEECMKPVIDVILLALLLTLNRSHTLFLCFPC